MRAARAASYCGVCEAFDALIILVADDDGVIAAEVHAGQRALIGYRRQLRQLGRALRRARLRNAGQAFGALATLGFELRDPFLQRFDFLAAAVRGLLDAGFLASCSCRSFSCFCSRPSCASFSAIAASSSLRNSSCSRCAADAKMMLSSGTPQACRYKIQAP